MIQILFAVLAAEAAATVALLFKTPARRLVMAGLDRLKRGRGPIVMKTVAATAVILIASSVYSMVSITGKSPEKIGAQSPTDQIIFFHHLIQATLLGYILFLALVIDRLHNYVREMRRLRRSAEVLVRQNRSLEEAARAAGTNPEELLAKDQRSPT